MIQWGIELDSTAQILVVLLAGFVLYSLAYDIFHGSH